MPSLNHSLAVRELREHVRVQLSEVGLLGLGLTGEVGLDPLRDIHLGPDASNVGTLPGEERVAPGRAYAPRARRSSCPHPWSEGAEGAEGAEGDGVSVTMGEPLTQSSMEYGCAAYHG